MWSFILVTLKRITIPEHSTIKKEEKLHLNSSNRNPKLHYTQKRHILAEMKETTQGQIKYRKLYNFSTAKENPGGNSITQEPSKNSLTRKGKKSS